jgi:hypothetical protein
MNTILHSINFVCDPKRGQETATAEIEKTVNSLGFQVGGITWDRPVKGLAPVAASVSVHPAPNWKPQRISHAMRRLHDMRLGMEADLEACGLPAVLNADQATLLADTCAALGMNRAEQMYVVGPAIKLIDEESCGLMATEPVLLSDLAGVAA